QPTKQSGSVFTATRLLRRCAPRNDASFCLPPHFLDPRRRPHAAHTLPMRDKPFAVYILTTRRRTVLYTGVTNDIGRRINEHRMGLRPSFTRRYNVTRLVHVEWFRDARTAIAREKQIKGGSRPDKVALIERGNPGWNDLAVEMGLVAG
ncbi:MAG TPA: GIY-YIG nuclease family protein, partial [Gemmatimonadales bacterium]|nr:GIY-YIG nuclease family protein [Gemmatimonadales bacterium]